MKNEIINEQKIPLAEPIVIADECGDTMWDAVLNQEGKTCEINNDSGTLKALFNKTETVQEGDENEVK